MIQILIQINLPEVDEAVATFDSVKKIRLSKVIFDQLVN